MNYNFCRIHKTLRVTPAMAAGVTDRVWSIADIVSIIEVGEVAPAKTRAIQETSGVRMAEPDPFEALQACIGGLIAAFFTGAFGLTTWSETLFVWFAFSVALYFTLRWKNYKLKHYWI